MKKLISTLLTTCLLASSVCTANAATVWRKASDWAVDDLNAAYEADLFPYRLEDVDLTKEITRAEQAALSVKIYEALTGVKAVTPANNPFTDTKDTDVLKAYALGFTTGTSETTFEPKSKLTREQASSMLARIYKRVYMKGWTLAKDGEFKFEFAMPDQFKDHSTIASWAEQSVYFMASKKWILGNEAKEFMPQNSCSREQALIIAQRMVNELKSSGTVKLDKFTVACIGGSLTAGGGEWIENIKKYIQAQMPEKTVVTVNAGISGTTSQYGARRFEEHILEYEPDLVIIEFAVNDNKMGSNSQIYMESMIRQSLGADKVPAVMFLNAPSPYTPEKDSANYTGLLESIQVKEKLAAHYNIPTVNGMEYIKQAYEKEGSDKSYFDWLAKYYIRAGETYDVHPNGNYKLFSDAIIAEFDEKGLDTFLKPVSNASVFRSDSTSTVNKKYNYRYPTDSDVTLSSEWQVSTKAQPYNDFADPVNAHFYNAPHFPKGVAITSTKGAKITFKTTADAISLAHISSNIGGDVIVVSNGQEVGSTTTFSNYDDMNYAWGAVELPGDGEKTVELVAKEDGKPLKIGAIIEEFAN